MCVSTYLTKGIGAEDGEINVVNRFENRVGL